MEVWKICDFQLKLSHRWPIDQCWFRLPFQQDAWDSAHIACLSQQCLHENYQQMLEKNNCHLLILIFEWHGDIMSGESRMKLFWNLHLKPKTVSELKVALEKIWDCSPEVHLTKLSGVLQIFWQEYVNDDGRHSNHFLYSKTCFALTAFVLSWIVETVFDNASTAKLPWLKAA